MAKLRVDGSSHSHRGPSKIRNNEKLKGKLEEQRKVVAANDKKGGNFPCFMVMKIGTWNIREGIQSFIKQHDIDVMVILETKLGESKLNLIMPNKFGGLSQINNFHTH